MTHCPLPTLLLSLSVSLASVSAQDAVDPPAEPPWQRVEAEPGWYSAPPARTGWHRFASMRRSNLVGLAQTRAMKLADHDARDHLGQWLAPHLGRPLAQRVAARVEGRLRAQARAFRFEWLTDAGGNVPQTPGNSLATAWVLWEAPIAELVADLPEEARAAAQRVLALPVVPWRRVDAPPAWGARPPAKAGCFRFALRTRAEAVPELEVAAMEGARDGARAVLVERLQPVLGDAAEAAEAALRGLALIDRAWSMQHGDEKDGGRWTVAWTLWEVPHAAVLAAVPAERWQAVETALR